MPETLLVALYLRAVETQRADGIIRDDRIRFVQEWNYLDRHGDRWRFMRLFAYIPPLKRHIMNKIVHLRFRKDGEVMEK